MRQWLLIFFFLCYMSSEGKKESGGVLLWVGFLMAPEIIAYRIFPDNLIDLIVHSIHSSVCCSCSADDCCLTCSGVYVSSFSLDYKLLEGRGCTCSFHVCYVWIRVTNTYWSIWDFPECEESKKEDSSLGKNQGPPQITFPDYSFDVFIYFYKDLKCKLQCRML